jgi:prepilin-type processing-associated H-X9-DG protein
VRITRSVDGLPFEPSRQVNGGPIDTSCECCNIEITSIGEDEVFVAYMSNLRYVRDMFVSRSSDGGWTFDDPVQVNEDHWLVPACPITGPRMVAETNGHLNIVWLDGHEGVSNVYYARSTDGGRTFLHHTRMNDVRGRYVREVWSAGGALGWDGRDDRGHQVSPGLYFLRLPGVSGLRVTKLR